MCVTAMPRDKTICDILDSSFYKSPYRDRRNEVSQYIKFFVNFVIFYTSYIVVQNQLTL